VGLRVGLDAVAKRKVPCQELNPGHPAYSSVSILTELSQLTLYQLHTLYSSE